jgi:thymidylate synthase
MNNLDKQYQDLLKSILDYGVEKKDRTGTGTKSIFGYTIRHKMSDGFPLLTTKKMAWKTMVTELLWFLRGDTNIKYLVDNDCHIWDGDAFKYYTKKVNEIIDGYKCGDIMGMQDHIEKLFSDSDKLTPLTMDEFINKIKTDDEFAKQWGDLGPIYGKQWRKWVGQDQTAKGSLSASTTFGYVDQIQNLINDLKTNPDSRRLMVSAWNVGELDQMVLPPCHYGFQVYTRELNLDERIEILRSITDPFNFHSDYFHEHLDYYNIPRRTISLMWNQRSVDTFLGLPFNIASYGLLLEIIAKMVNMVPDELIGNLGDTHLYLNHIEQAKEQIERKPFDSLPTLNINTEFWSYKGGECGEGPLDAIAILNSFKDDNFCKCLLEEDLQLSNYQSHPTIKAPLSN